MKAVRVGILGATGAVGLEMGKTLTQTQAELEELRLLAGPRSAGKRVIFGEKEYPVEACTKDSFAGLDYVLGASEAGVSRLFDPAIRSAGAVYIDNSSAFRLDPDTPLVVPEINGEDALGHRGRIANPNCCTVIATMALAPLAALRRLRALRVCTYQAASGAGLEGIRELEDQLEALHRGRDCVHRVFPAQLAMNVIPHIGAEEDNGYTEEEMKLQREGRRILHLEELAVSCTCVRVPVLRSHAIAITAEFDAELSPETAKEALRSFPGLCLTEDWQGRDYPTPLDTAGQDLVWVGRVRRDLCSRNGLCLWCCGDQLRKGAAANAVQILNYLRRET